MKAALKYPGSKWRIANWIISYIPEHRSYVEPYLGSGAVFFNKARSPIETINDLDGDVVNLFQCIREDSKKLAALVASTPYSRQQYNEVFDDKSGVDSFECPPISNTLLDGGRCSHGNKKQGGKTMFKGGRPRMHYEIGTVCRYGLLIVLKGCGKHR